MTEVRKHKRQTASGKTTTVRHHTRRGGDGKDDPAQARAAWQDRAAPHYSTLPATAPPAADESFWDEDSAEPDGEWWAEDEPNPAFAQMQRDMDDWHAQGERGPSPAQQQAARLKAGEVRRGDRAFAAMQEEMRAWRSRPVPDAGPVVPDTSPLGRALGTDTQEGAEKFARLSAYRDAGYTGPLDSDNRIPDPDDPANYESLHALAAMSE